MDRTCSTHGELRNAYNISIIKLEGNRPLKRLRSRLEDYIRMDVWEIGWKLVDWIHLTEDRNRWRVMSLRVP